MTVIKIILIILSIVIFLICFAACISMCMLSSKISRAEEERALYTLNDKDGCDTADVNVES